MTEAGATNGGSVVLKLDYRPGATDALHSKVSAVERRLAE